MLTDLQNRGVKPLLIACIDGLKGFPDAKNQWCIVHRVCNSTKLVSWADYKELEADLRRIYQLATEKMASLALGGFADKWGVRYTQMSELWVVTGLTWLLCLIAPLMYERLRIRPILSNC